MIGLIQGLSMMGIIIVAHVESYVRPLRITNNFKNDMLHELRGGWPFLILKLILVTLFIVATFIGSQQNAKTESPEMVSSSQVEDRG